VAENAARLCEAKDAAIFQVEGDELEMVVKFGPTQLWPISLLQGYVMSYSKLYEA